MSDEYGWVIEGDGNYWDGTSTDPERSFTTKHEDAVRFARRQDADKVKHWLLKSHAFALKTVEHGWAKAPSENAR